MFPKWEELNSLTETAFSVFRNQMADAGVFKLGGLL